MNNPLFAGTVGDEASFLRTLINCPPQKQTSPFPLSHDRSRDFHFGEKAVLSTFRYLYDKFRKGCFVQIREGTLKTLLPFVNLHYQNEWSNRIIDPPQGRLVQEVNRWYANNGVVRNEKPFKNSHRDVEIFRHMLEICSPGLPDIDFFLNYRDAPLLTHNGTEPYVVDAPFDYCRYDRIWGQHQPLVSRRKIREQCCPIMSLAVDPSRFDDVLFPTYECWTQAVGDRKLFEDCQFKGRVKPIAFSRKKSVMLFRGSSTGWGISPETNDRLWIVQQSLADKTGRLDARITYWNLRPRLIREKDGRCSLKTFQPYHPAAPNMTLQQQSNYKYLIHIPGHTAAFRLGSELSTGSVVLKFPSSHQLWFERHLEPWKHFIPVNRTNLWERFEWAEQHPKECQMIAKNALLFWNERLSEKAIVRKLRSRSPFRVQFVHETCWNLVESYSVVVQPIRPPKPILPVFSSNIREPWIMLPSKQKIELLVQVFDWLALVWKQRHCLLCSDWHDLTPTMCRISDDPTFEVGDQWILGCCRPRAGPIQTIDAVALLLHSVDDLLKPRKIDPSTFQLAILMLQWMIPTSIRTVDQLREFVSYYGQLSVLTETNFLTELPFTEIGQIRSVLSKLINRF